MNPGRRPFMEYLPVVPMTLISGLLIVVVSLVTRPPGPHVLARYYQARS